MKLSILAALAIAGTIVCAGLVQASSAKSQGHSDASSKVPESGARVDITYRNWRDETRGRTIPVKVYSPHRLAKPAPVVLFSHGLGGSTEAAIYLGKHWASQGYVCFFLQHPGSDDSFWKNARADFRDREQLLQLFRTALRNPLHAVNRVNDVHFAIDQIEQINRTVPAFKNKLDVHNIAIAGHSFGSWTALAASGQQFATPSNRILSSVDARLKAAIYLSPTPPRRNVNPETAFGSIAIPGLHITGTLDDSPVNDGKAQDRRIPFDHISKSDQYLLILNGADHMVFNGRLRQPFNQTDLTHQNLVKESTLKFLDAYLKRDKHSLAWLQQQASDQLRDFGTYEFKLAKR